MAVYPQTLIRIVSSQTRRRMDGYSLLRLLIAPLGALLIYYVWLRTAEAGVYPRFILPHPHDVYTRMETLHERGLLISHVRATLEAALKGLGVAVGLALPLGYVVARYRWISALLMPYLVAVRAIPVVAIAAIIIIWLGTGIQSKVFVVAFITWFPLMEAVVVGLNQIDPQLRDLMRVYRANPLHILWKLELPSALPNLLSGLKIAATLSVVGAAVGELIGANQGLAYLIMFGRGTSNAELVFGAVLLLTALSLTLYAIVAVLENILLAWRRAV